jgi:peptide/nickel transport system substrate-binding protein
MEESTDRNQSGAPLLKRALSRRALVGRALAVAASVPAVTLLAACGSDDEEPTATAAGGTGAPTPTEATAAATATEHMAEPTATGELAEPSPTSGEGEPTATAEGEATQPPPGGTFVEGGDPLMGQEFEPGVPGGTFVEYGYLQSVNFTHSDTHTWYIQRLIFQGLIQPSIFDYAPVGELAEAWEISDDAMTWTFFLREGVLFHDGEPFTAEDVVVSYAYQMDESVGGGAYTPLTELIASVEQVDDYTVAFTTHDVSPDFLIRGCRRFIAAAHVISAIEPADFAASPAGTGSDPAFIIGTGPFKFREFVSEDHITVDRFDDYWGGAPYLDTYITRVVQDGQATTTALLSGDADFVWETLISSRQELEQAGLILHEWQAPGFDVIQLNLDPERTPLFQDVRVRQALMFALDREAMLQVAYEGVGTVAETIQTRGTVFENPEGVTVRYTYDPERAMALLDEAGWMVGPDGVREKDGLRFAFPLTSSSDWEPYIDQVTIAQELWRAIGIEVELNLVPYDTTWELAAERDFVALMIDAQSPLAPDRTFIYGCGSPDNFTGYCNPEVDALLAEALVELDQARRIELYTEFQNIILTELPILPTISVNGFLATNPRVRNPPNGPLLTNLWYAVEKVWIEQ